MFESVCSQAQHGVIGGPAGGDHYGMQLRSWSQRVADGKILRRESRHQLVNA